MWLMTALTPKAATPSPPDDMPLCQETAIVGKKPSTPSVLMIHTKDSQDSAYSHTHGYLRFTKGKDSRIGKGKRYPGEVWGKATTHTWSRVLSPWSQAAGALFFEQGVRITCMGSCQPGKRAEIQGPGISVGTG